MVTQPPHKVCDAVYPPIPSAIVYSHWGLNHLLQVPKPCNFNRRFVPRPVTGSCPLFWASGSRLPVLLKESCDAYLPPLFDNCFRRLLALRGGIVHHLLQYY